MRISDWSSDVCSSDLGAGTGVQSERPPSGNLAAYTALLQGRQYSRAATDEAGHRKALDAYTEATRLDPGYALAYANQTIAWINISSLRTGPARQQAIAQARAAANTALPDRKSVVSGKGVSARVALGGRRLLKQKKKQ